MSNRRNENNQITFKQKRNEKSEIELRGIAKEKKKKSVFDRNRLFFSDENACTVFLPIVQDKGPHNIIGYDARTHLHRPDIY